MRHDLVYALRNLLRNKVFTLTALLTLALGIGANTAIFSVVQGVLLRSLPYPDAARLVKVYSYRMAVGGRNGLRLRSSIPDYLDWRAQTKSFAVLEAFRFTYPSVQQKPRHTIRALLATPGLLKLFGTRPLLGRLIQDEDLRPDAPGVVVLSYEFWVERYGKDPAVIGRGMRLGDRTSTIVGVAEPIRGPLPGQMAVILPWSLETDSGRHSRRNRALMVLGRLKEGTTLRQAQTELDVVGAALRRQYPESDRDYSPLAVSVYEEMVGGIRPSLWALLGATALLLLIAVSNIANMFLARGSSRRPELSIRSALGATPGRLARLLLAESLLLSLLGGLLGLSFGYGLVHWLLEASPPWVPRLEEIGVNTTVTESALLVTVTAGLLFGLAPLMSFRRQWPQAVLHWRAGQQLREGSRVRSALVVAQLALALVLLTGSGLMIRSFLALQNVPIGIDYRHIVTFSSGGFGVGSFGDRRTRALQLYRRALRNIKAIPGVVDATLTSQAPLTASWGAVDVQVLTGTSQGRQLEVDLIGVNPDFFSFFGSRALAGRLFEAHDSNYADSRVVIDANLARRIWGDESAALGQRLKINGMNETEIIGVSEPIRYGDLAKEIRPKLYNLLDQPGGAYGGTFLIRYQGRPEPIMKAIKTRVAEVDSSMRVSNLQPLEALYDQYLRRPRFYLAILAGLGALALVVASVGVFGVVSYSVGRRTREVGIRMALGASRPAIVGMFCRQTTKHLILGLAVGTLGSLWLTRYLQSLLFEVKPADPVTLTSMVLLLAIISLAATLISISRSLKVDPVTSLGAE